MSLLLSSVQTYHRKYKYVGFGITTDVHYQALLHTENDTIAWQRMIVKYRTEDMRPVKKLIHALSDNKDYIANNIRFPETLFDQRHTYYIYLLLGKRKKSKNVLKRPQYTFIDIFAGLGGFNTALSKAGCKCVFASDDNEDLRKLYALNHKIDGVIAGNIDTYPLRKIPHHDILCAQVSREENFRSVCSVIMSQGKACPTYLILEAVANIKVLDEGHIWNVMEQRLLDLGYDVMSDILSPHQFGFPQHRQRTYIVAVRQDIGRVKRFDFPVPTDKPCDIHEMINEKQDSIQLLTLKQHAILKAWQGFLDCCYEHYVAIPRFPVWAMEFGEDYPYRTLPRWKRYSIEQNRQFYEENKAWLKPWLDTVAGFGNSYQKMEWNVDEGSEKPVLKNNIVQFLASGIRVKAPTFSPALIGTLLPIIPWVKLPDDCVPEYTQEELAEYGLNKEDIQYGRYVTIHEMVRLQGLEGLSFYEEVTGMTTQRIYDTLGDSVNADVIHEIVKQLI